MQIILASASPRRAEILRQAGIAFSICETNVDETPLPGETAEAMVARLAEAKARHAARRIQDDGRRIQLAGRRMQDDASDCIVVGADTAVELDGEILGKPRDAADARGMLAKLSGRAHQVLTGIFVLRLPDGAARAAVEKSAVTFAPLSEREIAGYVASGEPMDKAGAYAIQGLAGRFIPRIEGCYFNVVGLPLARLCLLLRDLGWRGKA